MGLLLRCSFLAVLACSLFVVLEAQGASLGRVVPVGTYSFRGWNGEREFISSVGNAKVGVYRKVHHNPRPLAVIPVPVHPRYPPVHRYPAPVVKKPYPPKKGVSGRNGGLLGGLLGGGLLSGLLGQG